MPSRLEEAAAADRFANFAAATEATKGELERERERREKRHQELERQLAGMSAAEQEAARQAFVRREEENLLARCKVWTTADFEQVAVLGEGSFGIVHLVRLKGTKEHYALKQMQKEAYKQAKCRARVMAERNFLAETRSRWFVNLHITFQDAHHVYMAMEFLQGGDLLTHLMARGRFSPRETCFYMAELVEALSTVHANNFIHRDIKPDNIVLSASGHLKLLDFGLCADQLRREDAGRRKGIAALDARERLHSIVGTPLYMAPEILNGEYDHKVDIWAFGCLTFECLVGETLFDTRGLASDDAVAVDQIDEMVLNYETNVPLALHRVRARGLVPPSAEQLLLATVCTPEVRLSAEECKREPFFAGLDFSKLHLMTPPFRVEVSSPEDTRYFKAVKPKGGRYELPQPNASELALKDEALEWTRYEYDCRAAL